MTVTQMADLAGRARQEVLLSAVLVHLAGSDGLAPTQGHQRRQGVRTSLASKILAAGAVRAQDVNGTRHHAVEVLRTARRRVMWPRRSDIMKKKEVFK